MTLNNESTETRVCRIKLELTPGPNIPWQAVAGKK